MLIRSLVLTSLAGVLLTAAPAVTRAAGDAAPPAAVAAPVTPQAGPAEPPSKEHRAVPAEVSPASRLKTLYAELAKAPDVASAEKIVQAIEQIWSVSGSPTADLLLRRAISAAESKRPELALQFLDSLTELNPDWPEGFSRRAFVHFVRMDYARALGDLRRVLALDPGHFRALEGLVQILRTMGQSKAALDAARELVKVHPFSPGAQESLKELQREVDGQGI